MLIAGFARHTITTGCRASKNVHAHYDVGVCLNNVERTDTTPLFEKRFSSKKMGALHFKCTLLNLTLEQTDKMGKQAWVWICCI
jgi:hypothetical protein